jgi:hypothetical protein
MESMQGMKSILGSALGYHAAVAAIIVVVFSALARIVRALLRIIGCKIIARTHAVLDDRILRVSLDHVTGIMVVAGLVVAVREIHKGTGPEDQMIQQMLDCSGSLLSI